MGLNNPRTPSEMGESKLNKKWSGICSVLRPECDFFQNQSACYKKQFENRRVLNMSFRFERDGLRGGGPRNLVNVLLKSGYLLQRR